jgi:hypothetical protein
VGLVCGTWRRGIEEGGGVGDSLDTFGGWRRFTWSVEERNGKKIMYFVCDFNERWLKDLSFIYPFDVLLSVEGRVVLMINVACFL